MVQSTHVYQLLKRFAFALLMHAAIVHLTKMCFPAVEKINGFRRDRNFVEKQQQSSNYTLAKDVVKALPRSNENNGSEEKSK
jgi:hypothetical protein